MGKYGVCPLSSARQVCCSYMGRQGQPAELGPHYKLASVPGWPKHDVGVGGTHAVAVSLEFAS